MLGGRRIPDEDGGMADYRNPISDSASFSMIHDHNILFWSIELNDIFRFFIRKYILNRASAT